jgi:hypothetical protein
MVVLWSVPRIHFRLLGFHFHVYRCTVSLMSRSGCTDAGCVARRGCQHPAIIYCILFQGELGRAKITTKLPARARKVFCELEFRSSLSSLFLAPNPHYRMRSGRVRLLNDSFAPALQAAVQDSVVLVIHAHYQRHPPLGYLGHAPASLSEAHGHSTPY